MVNLRFLELYAAFLASDGVLGCALADHIFSSRNTQSSLPSVDLGYEIYRASTFNTTGQYYTFSNIRYGAPPVGHLRFSAPRPPSINRSTVQDGLVDRICPQALTDWLSISNQFVPRYLQGGNEFNASSSTSPAKSPNQISGRPKTVSFWIFLFLKPFLIMGERVVEHLYLYGFMGVAMLLDRRLFLVIRQDSYTQVKLPYVSINYRLGAFGFLGGPTIQEDGTANAGLHDQRFALEWVQKHIGKFGGDAKRVTILGESAGAGSILHQLIAYGGRGPAPFARAILQSPGVIPMVSNRQNENTLTTFLNYAGVSTLQDARTLPSETLQTANRLQIAASPYGRFTYSPTLDGDFVPEIPSQLLRQGRFHKAVQIFVAHNVDEGLIFTSPFLRNQSDIEKTATTLLPTLKNEPQFVTDLLDNLYPEEEFSSNGAISQRTIIARTAKFNGDASFNCNFFFLAKAFQNTSYAYRFAVEPALHGSDLAYTYYNGPSNAVTAPATALKMQQYITNFVRTGSPNGPNLPPFDIYGKEGRIMVLNNTNIYAAIDKDMEDQCSWLEKGLFF